MEGPLERPGPFGGDPSQMRVSDADRHRVADILREAAGEGRLDLEELDERLESTYAAKTYADLVPITADLPVRHDDHPPVPRPQPAGPLVPAARHDSSVAILGGCSRKGVWEVGPTHTAFAFCGGVDIDLREARFTSRETVINANAIWGGVDIYVNEWTNVVVEGVGIMGAFEQGRDKVAPQLRPDSPTIRVKGIALMAGVTVSRRPMPGTPRRRLLGGR
ncbi:DUF1707 domain-containing protein [Nocardioides sp. GCM10027113]|uniref:DUF1707 SHOCT-like domain-containing protein n=1 Tax=unclassified Nocardioides TaxID=2615069 RepID=UPI003607D2EF